MMSPPGIIPLYSFSFSFVRHEQGVPGEARSRTREKRKNKDLMLRGESGSGVPPLGLGLGAPEVVSLAKKRRDAASTLRPA
jgi:hypothetical protein